MKYKPIDGYPNFFIYDRVQGESINIDTSLNYCLGVNDNNTEAKLILETLQGRTESEIRFLVQQVERLTHINKFILTRFNFSLRNQKVLSGKGEYFQFALKKEFEQIEQIELTYNGTV